MCEVKTGVQEEAAYPGMLSVYNAAVGCYCEFNHRHADLTFPLSKHSIFIYFSRGKATAVT